MPPWQVLGLCHKHDWQGVYVIEDQQIRGIVLEEQLRHIFNDIFVHQSLSPDRDRKHSLPRYFDTRLFVYHSMSEDQVSRDRFCVMERKLLKGIMTPSMLVVLGIEASRSCG